MNHVQNGAGALSAIASRETALGPRSGKTAAGGAVRFGATSSAEAAPFWFGMNTTTIAFMPDVRAANRPTVN